MNVGQSINGYLAHASDMLWLYQNMSTLDRTKVRGFVKESLQSLVKLMEIDIDQANYVLGDTSKPGLVSVAKELIETTRQIIAELQAVAL